MNESRREVDATKVAELINADLSAAARRWGLGETQSVVALTHLTWPVVVTITSSEGHDGISIAIDEEPFASSDPAVHAQAAINLVCATLDEERSLTNHDPK